MSIGRMSANFASCAAFSIVPPMPTPTTIGGHGFEPGLVRCFEHKVNHTAESLRRLKHAERAHVLAAKALWRKGDMQLVTLYNIIVNHRGGIVFRVNAPERVCYDPTCADTLPRSLSERRR